MVIVESLRIWVPFVFENGGIHKKPPLMQNNSMTVPHQEERFLLYLKGMRVILPLDSNRIFPAGSVEALPQEFFYSFGIIHNNQKKRKHGFS